MYNYIILDDVYFDNEIELHIGPDIINFNKDNNEIIITIEQLIKLLREIISHERNERIDK